jgi:hypothetical protein
VLWSDGTGFVFLLRPGLLDEVVEDFSGMVLLLRAP